MKKLIVLACLATTVSMTTAGTATADSIKGKFGVTGKIGFMVPADNESDFYHNKTDTGLIIGGGIIYGVDDHFATEFEVSRTEFGSETGDFGVTNFAFGAQYRFALNQRQLAPYLGAGLDIIATDYDPSYTSGRDVDSTLGIHVSAGIDYFLQKNFALNAEARLVAAPNTDITDSYGDHRGDFDPSNFSTTIGVRYFFN